MRVVYAGAKLNHIVTGGDQYFAEVAKYLDASGVTIEFLQTDNSPGRFIKKSLVLTNLWYLWRFVRLPRGRDVILMEDYSSHLHLLLANFLIYLTRKARLVAIVQVFNFGYRRSRFKNFADKIVSRLFFVPMDMVIASSLTMAQDTATMMGVPKHKLRVVYPPIRSVFSDCVVPPSLVGNGSHVNLLFIGYFVPRKGIEYLLKALSILDGKDTRLNIVGDSSVSPPYTKRILTMVKELDIREQVHFAGRVEKADTLIELYQKADIFILPSTYESFGIVLVEAMCLGLPIVASRVGGIPELVEDGVNGILVPPRDPQSLANAISTLIKNPGLRHEMGQRSYQRSSIWRFRTGEDVGRECYQVVLDLAGG